MDEPLLCVSMEFAEAEGGDGEVVVLEMSDGSHLVIDALGVGIPEPGTHNTVFWDEIVQLILERS